MTDIKGPVIGYRSWYPIAEGGLHSIGQNHQWVPGSNLAKCLRMGWWHRAKAPATHCQCGLYAYHTLAFASPGYGTKSVKGVVRGWGQLQVHRDGWRAEHAEVIALIENPNQAEAVRAAALRFQVPVLPRQAATLLAEAEFGQTIPEGLRPDSALIDHGRGNRAETAVVWAAIVALYAGVSIIDWFLSRRKRK